MSVSKKSDQSRGERGVDGLELFTRSEGVLVVFSKPCYLFGRANRCLVGDGTMVPVEEVDESLAECK